MREELIKLIVEKSLELSKEPKFKLASGRLSETYIDCKKTTCNAKGKVLIGNIIYDRISKLDVSAIGGLTLGADPIANAVSYTSELKGKPLNTFIVRKAAKEHGLRKTIEGDVTRGDNVVVVDDVVTTGASTIQAIHQARGFGLNVIRVIVLVDRQEGGKENILKENVDFEAIITKQDLINAYNQSNREGIISGQFIGTNKPLHG